MWVIFFFTFILELFVLYLISRSITKNISWFFRKLTKHNKLTVYLISILFLPGTIIHELSHLIMAEVLRVPAGNINLIPKIIGSDIKMGSVQIANTDPLRRFLIGAAPFLFGNILLFAAVNLTINISIKNNIFFLIIYLYLIFQIGNTMFSSKKDMEGVYKIIIILLPIILIASFSGLRVNFEKLNILPELIIIINRACIYLLIPIVIDLMILIFINLFRRIML